MIYTVTFNPSLDYIVGVDEYQNGTVNRTSEETILPGGKGINVSIVLKNLGMESVPLGFVAGFTGAELKRLLKEQDIRGKFVEVKEGISRINVKLRSLKENVVTEETEINGEGPKITDQDLDTFYTQLDGLEKGDVLVLAGSIPSVLPPTMYKDIMIRLQEKEILIVVDSTRDLLVNVLEYHPFLIKPNNHELGEIFDVEIKDKADVVVYAKKLQEMGARNVLVSMAGDGAVFLSEDGDTYKTEAPKGNVKNSVGAGDSMVAGFVYGYLTQKDYEKAFLYGVCTGSASAFSDNLATYDEVQALLQTI